MIVFDQNEYVPCASNTRPDDCASATMPTRPERGMSCCAERRHGHTPLVAERLNSAEEKIRIILDRLIIFAGILPSLNTSDFKRLRISGMKPVLAQAVPSAAVSAYWCPAGFKNGCFLSFFDRW